MHFIFFVVLLSLSIPCSIRAITLAASRDKHSDTHCQFGSGPEMPSPMTHHDPLLKAKRILCYVIITHLLLALFSLAQTPSLCMSASVRKVRVRNKFEYFGMAGLLTL